MFQPYLGMLLIDWNIFGMGQCCPPTSYLASPVPKPGSPWEAFGARGRLCTTRHWSNVLRSASRRRVVVVCASSFIMVHVAIGVVLADFQYSRNVRSLLVIACCGLCSLVVLCSVWLYWWCCVALLQAVFPFLYCVGVFNVYLLVNVCVVVCLFWFVCLSVSLLVCCLSVSLFVCCCHCWYCCWCCSRVVFSNINNINNDDNSVVVVVAWYFWYCILLMFLWGVSQDFQFPDWNSGNHKGVTDTCGFHVRGQPVDVSGSLKHDADYNFDVWCIG